MILRIFEFGNRYHFRPHDQPQGGPPPPESKGVRVPSRSKFDITRAVIEMAWEAGVTVDGVTGRLTDAEAADGCGVRFVDTRVGRRGTGAIARSDAKLARHLFNTQRITREELDYKLTTPRSQWGLYRPNQPDWRP